MSYLPFARPTLTDDDIGRVTNVLRSGWIASGPNVAALEQALSAYVGGRPVRLLTSATGAMEVAMEMLGIGAGDEVITPAQSFFATSNMIERVGAKPVFVDVDLRTRNLDLAAAEAAITPRTKLLLPVHFSAPLDLDALDALAAKHQLRVLEDAALAIGSRWNGERVGSRGDLATFSFHPNKNMTTIEGGAIVVNTPEEAKRVEKLRFHGITRLPDGTRDVDFPGGKFNLSDVAAAVGLAQLPQLEGWIARRHALAQSYFAAFAAQSRLMELLGDDALPPDPVGHSWNMFPILLPLNQITISRKEFIDALHQREIGIGVSYEALHLSTLSRRNWGYREGMFPVSERISRETVTLPLFPTMTEADVARVVDALAATLLAAAR